MSAVGSVHSGVADLFNWLSNTQPAPVTSVLSSSPVRSALQSSSPDDLVQLSQQALQLQQAGSLFGIPDSSKSPTPESLLLQALTSSAPGSESTSTAAAATSALALEQAYQLFGTNSSPETGGGSYNFVG